MVPYKAQLQPDYITGTTHKIVIRPGSESLTYVPIDLIIAELEACGLKNLYEPDENEEYKFDFGAEFTEDFLLISYDDGWEITLRPTNNDAILYRLIKCLENSPNFQMDENLKHPIFTRLGPIGYLFLVLIIVGISRIMLINEAPGDPNTGGFQLALLAITLSGFSVGLHIAISQLGASVGTKFPKPINLNFIMAEFAAFIMLFLFVFSS